MKKRINFILFVFSWVLFSSLKVFAADPGEKNLNDLLKPFGLVIGMAENYGVKDVQVREFVKNTYHTVIGEKDQTVIKVEVISGFDEAAAKEYAQERYRMVDSLYDYIPSPYPGLLSNTIECAPAYKPKVLSLNIDSLPATVYFLHASPRFTYGVCSDDLIKYRSAFLFLYSKSSHFLYKIELFIPKGQYDEKNMLNFLRSISLTLPMESQLSDKNGVEKQNDQYNIILIALDPLSANHLSLYGYDRHTSPNLEKFSKNAFLFTQAISASNYTTPAIMSLFTSLYPSQHKVGVGVSLNSDSGTSFVNRLSPDVQTIAQVLKDNGYVTAGFSSSLVASGYLGFNKGFDDYTVTGGFFTFDDVLPLAGDWIREHLQDKIFLFIHVFDVHEAIKIKEEVKRRFSDPKYRGKFKDKTGQVIFSSPELLKDLNTADIQYWKDLYDSKIYEADKKFGDFIKSLKKMGVEKKTVIIFTAPSGTEIYEHKGFVHGDTCYDELIHVPLIIKIPGDKGNVISSQVRLVDVMPTLFDILNIDVGRQLSRQMEGKSLVPLMKGKILRLNAFSEGSGGNSQKIYSWRTPDGWKLIYTVETGQKELYDLNTDPGEQLDLSKTRKEKAEELFAQMKKFMKKKDISFGSLQTTDSRPQTSDKEQKKQGTSYKEQKSSK